MDVLFSLIISFVKWVGQILQGLKPHEQTALMIFILLIIIGVVFFIRSKIKNIDSKVENIEKIVEEADMKRLLNTINDIIAQLNKNASVDKVIVTQKLDQLKEKLDNHSQLLSKLEPIINSLSTANQSTKDIYEKIIEIKTLIESSYRSLK